MTAAPQARRRTVGTATGRQRGIDAAVLAVLLGLGVLGFWPSFNGNGHFLVAGIGGVLLGLAIAAAAARWRLGLLHTVGLTVLLYLLAGHPLAAPEQAMFGFVPSLESLRGLLLGVVLGWKQLLTLAPPVGSSVDVLVVPFLAALVCAVVAGTLAWRVRRPAWTMLPVLGLFLASIALGTSQPFLPTLRAVLVMVLGLAWLVYRRDLLRGQESGTLTATSAPGLPDRGALLRRAGLAAGVLALAGGITLAAAPGLTAAADRQVLRDAVVPPPDLHDLPSPLTGFRQYVKDRKDDVLFTAEGLPKGARVRIAAMDDYDGVVYSVDQNSSASFAPVGDPGTLNGSSSRAGTTAVGFDISGYSGVWIPALPASQGLAYSPADGQEHRFYLNRDSGSALTLDGVREGDRYTLDAVFPVIDQDKLAAAGYGKVTMPTLENVPQIVDTKANDIAGAADTPLKKVLALESTLQRSGKFSNGLEGQTPSTSGHGAARITKLLGGKEMVGDDEQYAVAMALMARHLGIPARVVMGFYLDEKDPASGAGTIGFKGADVHAWVEVNFDGFGWVPFTPTPDKDNIPNPPEPQNASTPKPQVLQPPPPPREPADLPPDSSPDALDTDGRKKDGWNLWGPLLTVLGLAALPVAAVALPLMLIAMLKARRRKRRSSQGTTASRIGGGWNEVLSAATDLGLGINPRQTRKETAHAVEAAFPVASTTTAQLARRADASIFGAGTPSEEEVRDYWGAVDAALHEMRQPLGFWQRQRARFSPRSLITETGSRRPLWRQFRSIRRKNTP
jgi:Transglutaminase-like superfamily/TgpA N-terminal domain